MASVSSIRDGLKTALATISGLRTHDTVPENVNPPVAIVGPPEITYDQAMARGLDTFTFPVLVLVSKASQRVAQDDLDAYCAGSGASSVKAAIRTASKDSGSTLRSAAQWARVVSFRPLNVEEVAAIGYWGGEFTVEVGASGA